MTFYDRVQELCKLNGKSITAVAVGIGMSKSVPYNWKHGTQPHNATIQKVANYFGMTSAELLNYDGGVISQVHPASAFTQCAGNDDAAQLSEMERELVRLFRKMPVLQQAQLIVSINNAAKDENQQ